MSSFGCAESDKAVQELITCRYEELKVACSQHAERLERYEAALNQTRRHAAAWRHARPGSVTRSRLPEPEPPAPPAEGEPASVEGEKWESLERYLATGLAWDNEVHVAKRRRRAPAPKDGAGLPPCSACPSLVAELVDIGRQSDEIVQMVMTFVAVVDMVTPPPEEGSNASLLMKKVKSRLMPMLSALRGAQTMHSDFLTCRSMVEEEYYRHHMASDWKEVIDAFDYGSWQKLIRMRKLFICVIAFSAAVMQRNAKQIEKHVTQAVSGKKSVQTAMYV